MLDQVGIHTHLAADAVVDGKLVLVLGLVWRLIVAAQLRPALKQQKAPKTNRQNFEEAPAGATLRTALGAAINAAADAADPA
jgi:hypothetical protein